MPVTAETQAILNLRAGAPPLNELPVEEARAQMAAMRPPNVDPEPVAQVHEMSIPGPGGEIPARGYLPNDDPRDLPTVVYYHGGGWVLGDLESHDAVCRALCNRAGMSVLSVDYRLAPEATYPAAAEDAYAAVEWIAGMYSQQGQEARIAVAGDSAGGNLAAVVSQMARDRGGPEISAQILIYPVTDHSFETESYKVNGGGEYGLSEAGMRWFWDLYLNDGAEGGQPYASPLRAENLSGLPRALTVTAEYDALRDEGEAYASALSAAGVPSSCTRYDGVIHGFVGAFAAVPEGSQALDQIAAELRAAFEMD